MKEYRMKVRIELLDEETGKVVLHDEHLHYFATTVHAASNYYAAVEDAVTSAMVWDGNGSTEETK